MTNELEVIDVSQTHTVHEDFAWTENVGNHPARKDSPTYTHARKYMIKAVQASQPWFYGPAPYQDHHSGAVFLRDDKGWLMVKNIAGLEWSSQFCLDPVKLDLVRVNAERLVAGFPLTEPAYKNELGMSDEHLAILHKTIVTADDIAKYVDSFWNASQPLPAAYHTGVLTTGTVAGVHHYPGPIVDIAFVKHDDFVLFVKNDQGNDVAVVPTHPRGSGETTVKMLYDPSDHHAEGTVIPADHPIAVQAYAKQT